MGKEWLSWIGRGASADRRPSSHCMCCVFKLFDFYTLNRQPHLDSYSSLLEYEDEEMLISTGLEAPRNSLDLSRKEVEEEEKSFKSPLPVGIQIQTNHCRLSSSESVCDSPGVNTPNLVARLMGLDLLPQCTSSSISSSNSKLLVNIAQKVSARRRSQDDTAVRSLPETPRISSGRISDVESPRLSLQISKANANADFALKEMMPPRPATVAEEKYGNQSLLQGESRRFVGADITNIGIGRRKRNKEVIRNDNFFLSNMKKDLRDYRKENVVQMMRSSEKGLLLKPRKRNDQIVPEQIIKSLCTNKICTFSFKENSFECNKLRFPDQQKRKKNSTNSGNQIHNSPSQGWLESQSQSQSQKKSKKIGLRISEKEKKDKNVLLSATRHVTRELPQKQVSEAQSCAQLSSNWYKLSPGKLFHAESNSCSRYDTEASPAGKILQLSGYRNYAALVHRPELLNSDTSYSYTVNGDERLPLVDESFSAVNYEEIDSLIDLEVKKMKFYSLMEKEEDGIVVEIQGEILERLVTETVTLVGT